jgi:cobalt/nickel transport system permease protein
MALLDRYQHQDSPLHRLDPRVKVVGTVGAILNHTLLPDGAWFGFASAWGLLLVLSHHARLGTFFTVKRSFIALPFMLAGASVLVATVGTPLAQFELFGRDFIVTDTGIIRFVSLMLRTWLSVQVAILLTATTPFPDITHALRQLKVPPVLVAIVSFMYRYLFVLADEAQRLLRARRSRSAAVAGVKAGGALHWRATTTGGMAGQLFVRSLDRADRVYQAMAARGYRGTFLTLTSRAMTAQDWQMGVGVALVLMLIQVLARLLP